jgi:hypothetical protein
MREFEDLKKIVRKFTEKELKIHLCKPSTSGVPLTHGTNLVKLVYKNPAISCLEAQIQIYGREKTIAFNQLVHRTKEELFDVLISNDSVLESNSYGYNTKMVLSLRKQIILFDILNLRGLTPVANRLINKVIKKSKHVESYDTLTLALYSRLRINVVNLTSVEYDAYLKEIDFYEDCLKSYHRSRTTLHNYYSNLSSRLSMQGRVEMLRKQIEVMELDHLRTGSKKILYNLLILKAEYYETLDEFAKSLEIKNQILELLKLNSHLSSNYYIGVSILGIAVSRIQLLDLRNAFQNLIEAHNYLNDHDLNRFVVNKYQFLANFFLGDTRQTEHFIDLLNSYLYSGVIVNFFAAEVRYYNACLKFIVGEYSASYLLLQNTRELEKDKESWNVAIRVLGIMNQIESENYELADSLVENLRKHYERLKRNMFISKRDEVIVQVLLALSRHSYNFKKTFRLRQESFNKLESMLGPYRWKILSPEMIIFHEWFLAKLHGQKYQHFERIPELIRSYASAMEASMDVSRLESFVS